MTWLYDDADGGRDCGDGVIIFCGDGVKLLRWCGETKFWCGEIGLIGELIGWKPTGDGAAGDMAIIGLLSLGELSGIVWEVYDCTEGGPITLSLSVFSKFEIIWSIALSTFSTDDAADGGCGTESLHGVSGLGVSDTKLADD